MSNQMRLYANTELPKENYYHFVLINYDLKEVFFFVEDFYDSTHLESFERFFELNGEMNDDYIIAEEKMYHFVLELRTKECEETRDSKYEDSLKEIKDKIPEYFI